MTTRGRHLLDESLFPKAHFTHIETNVDLMFLGFEGQRILVEKVDQFDYLCFIEDDLLIHDPLLFEK